MDNWYYHDGVKVDLKPAESPLAAHFKQRFIVARQKLSALDLVDSDSTANSWGPPLYDAGGGVIAIPDGKVNVLQEDLKQYLAQHTLDALLTKVQAKHFRDPVRHFPAYVFSPNDGNPVDLANRLTHEFKIQAQPRFVRVRPRSTIANGPAVSPLPTEWDEVSILERQWGLRQIEAPAAWAVTRGEPAVVAVIDSGVDPDHPDLTGKLQPGFDAVASWAHLDADPMRLATELKSHWEDAHGTACAGVIVAQGRFALGVAPGCTVLPIRFSRISEHLYETPECLPMALGHAIENGAWILSNSYGLGDDLPDVVVLEALRKGMAARGGKGCVVVAAAGNDGQKQVERPARYPGVIAVAATDRRDRRWRSGNEASNTGPQISVSAPGEAIWTTDVHGPAGQCAENPPADDYWGGFGGTSAACAFVAGVAALILSANPDLRASEVQEILESTADPLKEDGLGRGRVNARKAVQLAQQRKPKDVPSV